MMNEKKNVKLSSQKQLSGHRGIPSKAPENTLASFRLARELGASWIETDVQLTMDKVPVIIHDRKVNRTSNGRGVVSEMTSEHISRLDAGGWFSEEFAGEKIPTLQQTLKLCVELGLSLNLELKRHPGDDATALVSAVIDVVKAASFPLDKLVFSSFSVEALALCQKHYPEARRGFITEKRHLDFPSLITHCGLFSVHLNHKIASEKLVSQLRNEGVSVAIWTMNDASKADYFYNIGVDNIMSDCVDAF